MKTKVINGQSTCLCETCENEFTVGETYIIHTIPVVVNEITNYYGLQVPVAKEDVTDLVNHQLMFHAKCLNILTTPTGLMDHLKTTLNNLPDAQRSELYKYLHNILGCRL